VKDGNKNRLRHQDIHKIVDVFNKQIELPKYSRMVPVAEIAAHDYNLNIPRYIDSTEPEDVHDIEAHLLGGIPNYDIDALDIYWQVFPTLKQPLFGAGPRAGYSQLRMDVVHVKSVIHTHPEYKAYIQAVGELYMQWQTNNMPHLVALCIGSSPKQLIETISEDLLRIFAEARLIDKYDVYQHLMSYWTDTMQDDVYMIAVDGWCEANRLRLIVEDKDSKNKEKADLVIGKLKYKADLIPPSLIIARYFAAEQQAIETMEVERENIIRQMEEMDEEHGGEDGLLAEVKNEKGVITKGTVTARLKDIFADPDTEDERTILNAYLDLLEQGTEASKKVKDAQKALDAKVASRYKTLSENEIKALVVDDKWLATLAADVQTELNRISQALTGRIKELAERYATPLPKLTEEVETLSAHVDEHLKKMGFVW
jgi:type I restriction enzyme M protein